MEEINALTTTVENVSNYGVMAVIAAMFLLLTGSMLITCFQWFKHIINSIIDRNEKIMNQLVMETKTQNQTLSEISESLKPADWMKIQYVINISFEAYVGRACKIVGDIIEENNIKDKENTKRKIHQRVGNLCNQRNTELSIFSYGNKKLSEYMDPAWVEKMSEVIEREVYNESGVNPDRTYAVVKAAYDEIKNELYSKIQ